MDRMLNSKSEKESIYEIYRACRLCGGGAGYKMPIIQTIIDLDEADVELKQKIRECVQIEVHQDDKMPPLICELCVDKVNDFYEFLEMCRQTNKRTRLRLGLPPQSLPRGAPDAGDCILGLTEPIFVNDDSEGESSKHKKHAKGKLIKREPVVRIKIENLEEERKNRSKSSKRPPTPPRITRHSKSKDDDISLSNLKDKSKSSKLAPKSILKKENNIKRDDLSTDSSSSRLKRGRDKEAVKIEVPSKRVKITIKPPTPPSRTKPSPKSSPKSSPRLITKPSPRPLRSPVASPPVPPSPVRENYKCGVCGQNNKTSQARASHMRSHGVGYISSKLACNPCEEWFSSPEEAAAHQKRHKTKNIPYTCWRCLTDFKRLSAYEDHLTNNECLSFNEVPDVKCDVCWHLFATQNLLDNHKCLGEDHRPGGKCSKCNKSYALFKNLKKHEGHCTAKKKGELIISKKLLSMLKPIQVRVARCDPLLSNIKQEHYDVSCVSPEFGLDSNCIYPYISGQQIKSEFHGMVNIQDEIKKEFCSEDYVHWDSDDDDEDITCNAILNPSSRRKKVDSLAALALKTIFSQRFLGKVPRKKRKVKIEKAFDSLLADQDEVSMDINSIIDNLDIDDSKDDDNDSLDLMTNFSQSMSSGNDLAKDDINDKDTVNDLAKEDINDKDTVNDLAKEDINDKDTVNDLAKDDIKDKDSVNDIVNDSSIHKENDAVCNNDSNKSDIDDSIQALKKIDDILTKSTNSVDVNDKNGNDSAELTNNDSSFNKAKPMDESLDSLEGSVSQNDENSLSNLNQESLLLNNDSKSNDSIANLIADSKAENNDSKTQNLDTNVTIIDNLELNVSKNVQNNDKNCVNDAINDRTLTGVNDTKIEESNCNDKVSNNDKIALEDLISKTTDSKLGLGSIDDFSFDS